MEQSKKNIFIITGETSGDMHGAELIKSIKKKRDDITFSGIGGELLKSENVKLIHNFSEINFIGFSSVIKNYAKIKSVLNDTIEYIMRTNPDILILVDFPGFNLKIAESVRKNFKGKIIYYISPQIWAWHKSRVKKMIHILDKMLVIFPFEVDFYEKEGIKADYVGHPLINRIDNFLFGNNKIANDKIIITILPGTREEEIKRMYPVLANTANRFSEKFNAGINVVYPSNTDLLKYQKGKLNNNFNLIPNTGSNIYKTLLNSNLVFTKFGTSTLECAFLGTPFVTAYKANYLNYYIVKMLSNVKYVSLPNILLNKRIVSEFLQGEMTVDNLYNEGNKIILDMEYRENMIKNLRLVKEIFINTPVAKSAQDIIIEEL